MNGCYESLRWMIEESSWIPQNSAGGSLGIYAETRPPVLWTGKTKCGRVLKLLLKCGRVKIFLFLLNLMYHGLQYVGLLRALYTSCYCHII